MTYLFGSCRLDVESRELVRDGSSVHLSPKAFELLRLLVDARPRVLTKDALMNQLWPSTYVAEGNLPVLIGEVRAAVGDAARESRLIKTHFGVGYSFVGAATELRTPHLDRSDGPAAVLRIGGRRIVLALGPNTIGRDPESHIWLNDDSVSRLHARIIVEGTQSVLDDLNSKNGTTVRGTRIGSRTELHDGDRVRFGSVEATYCVERLSDISTATVVRE